MREILNRIKRGELQLYLSLVQTYLAEVYFSARDSHDEEEAIRLTRNIFTKLYDKVLSYIFIFDAKSYIENNLEKISSKQGVPLRKKYFNDSREVPEIVLRKILMEISAKSKSKKRRLVLVAVPIMALIFIVGITLISQVSSSNDTHPKGTIIGIEDHVEEVYVEKFNISANNEDEIYKILNFYKLDNERVLIEKIEGKSYLYEIYEKEQLLDTHLSTQNRMQFLTLTNDGQFIFKSDSELVKYNAQLELTGKHELLSNLYKHSDNKRYALYKTEKTVVKIDLYNFSEEEIVSVKEDRIIKLKNDGTFITEQELLEQGYQDIIDANNLTYKIIDDQVVALSELGVLKLFEEGEPISARKLAHYEDLELTQTHDYKPHMRTTLNYNEEYLIVAIRSRSNSNFEVYDRKSGELVIALADTLRSGDHVPSPVLSDDGKAFLLATQYKTRRQAIRFNAVYDLSTKPIHEHQLTGVGHIEFMEILGSDDNYYVYTFDDNGYFRIYKVEFVND